MWLAWVNSTVLDASIKEGIGYETVRGIIDRSIAKNVDWQAIKNLEIIGIDEISLKKGHQDFVTIVTGRMGDETVILGMLADRKKETVKRFPPVNFPVIAYEFEASCKVVESLAASMGNQKRSH